MPTEPNWKKKALQKLETAITDIANLEVVTLSGKLTVKDLNLQNPGSGIKFDQILDHITGSPSQSSKVSVVAATKIQLDKDIQQFVKEDMSSEEKELFNLHTSSIAQSHVARKATFEMLLSIVNR